MKLLHILYQVVTKIKNIPDIMFKDVIQACTPKCIRCGKFLSDEEVEISINSYPEYCIHCYFDLQRIE